MCGRKLLIEDPDKLRRIYGVVKGPTPNFPPNYNLAITDREPIVRLASDGDRRLELATWDYRDAKVTSLKGRPPFYNARAESMSKAALFADRRCLVPVSGFYEWVTINGRKQPYAFMREDRAPFSMAGIWSDWINPEGGNELTYVELTVAPSPLVAEIHNRMPLVIDEADWDAWLTDTSKAKILVKPNPLNGFVRYAVNPAVNSVKAAGPHLLAAVEPEKTLL